MEDDDPDDTSLRIVETGIYQCVPCNQVFNRKSKATRHLATDVHRRSKDDFLRRAAGVSDRRRADDDFSDDEEADPMVRWR